MSLRTTVFTSDDDNQLVAQLNDGIDLCLTRQKPYFMPFMSERKQAVLFSELKKLILITTFSLAVTAIQKGKCSVCFLMSRAKTVFRYLLLIFLSEYALNLPTVIFSVL